MCVCVCVCVCVCKLTTWSYACVEVAVTGQLALAQGRLRPVETEGPETDSCTFGHLVYRRVEKGLSGQQMALGFPYERNENCCFIISGGL